MDIIGLLITEYILLNYTSKYKYHSILFEVAIKKRLKDKIIFKKVK
jgi:hypothetical protein